MDAANSASPGESVRLHEFSLPEKVDHLARVALEWATHLTHPEFRLVSWLVANTVSRGKRSGTYSHEQLVNGVRKVREAGMWTVGTGLPIASVRRAIASCREKGVITTTAASERGTTFSVVLSWNPQTGQAKETNVVALNLPRARRRADLIPVQHLQAAGEEAEGKWGSDHGDQGRVITVIRGGDHGDHPSIEKLTNQETYNTTVDHGATAAEASGPRTVLPKIRERNRSAASVQTSNASVPEPSSPSPRCAAPPPAAPVLPLGDERQSVEAAVALAQRAADARRAAALKRYDPRAWEITWKAAWGETYEAVGCHGWSVKAVGSINKAVKASWPANRLGEVHAMLEFAVRNWDTIIRKHFAWMTKSPPPERPDIEFVGKFLARFHEAYASKAELEWLGVQDGTKQAVHALVKRTGMTRENALAHVLAKARESKDLVEARKLAAQAKRDREIQILAADRAERATRFTADNPHPRAHENKRPPVKLADKPIWETKISTPKFGEAEPDFVEAEWSVPHLPAVDPNSW